MSSHPPFTLADLDTRLQGKQTITLVPDTLDGNAIAGFYGDLLAGSLVVDEAAVTRDVEGGSLVKVIVTGQTTAFNRVGPAPVSIEFTEVSGQLRSRLVADLLGVEELPGVALFSLTKLQMAFEVGDDGQPSSGMLSAELSAAPGFRLTIGLPVYQNVWLIEGAFDSSTANIANFFAVCGVNLTTVLPSPLNSFADLGIRDIALLYDADAQSLAYIRMTIATSHPWQLLPKVTVTGLDLDCLIENPGDQTLRSVGFTITGGFSIPAANANQLQVVATVPDVTVTASLVSGKVALGDLLTFFMDASVDLASEITDFSMTVDPGSQAYALSAAITADHWELDFGVTTLSLRQLGVAIASNHGKVTGGIVGTLQIGGNNGVDLLVSAEHPVAGGGWVYSAAMAPGSAIPVLDLVDMFLQALGGAGSVPGWVQQAQLNVSDVAFTAVRPSKLEVEGGKSSSYSVQGSVVWKLEYGGITSSLLATVRIEHDQAKGTSGAITGAATLLDMPVILGYEFSTADKDIYFEWEGIRGRYTKDDKGEIVTLLLGNKSLGEIVASLMQPFEPGFRLSAPWNLLDDIDFDGLSLVYNLTTGAITVTYPHEIKVAFLTFTRLTFTKNKQGVLLSAEGSFLGIPISVGQPNGLKEGRPVNDLPTVPGAGGHMFDLQYLGMGQHVVLYPTTDLHTVEEASSALKNVFKPAPPAKSGNPPLLPIPVTPPTPPAESMLIFDERSAWLIATQFSVLDTVTLSIIFNDPVLYGLLIELSGDKAKSFAGLKFEILYKKVSDSIGVYQLQLQVPEGMRHLEFGEVALTLPIIGIDIYTNGNFKVDFGFPANLDFSRSLTIEAFPFTGAGGFYFAWLSGATSSKVPATTAGRFDPVIEFGLGLQLGIGKDFEEGILKAGLSLTVIGIVEGVLAFYHPNQDNYPGKDEHYYWIQGTVGLAGHIYGEINFAIVSARVDLTITAYIRLTIESYNAIPIYLEATVSVSLAISINLGLFTIHISFSFETTVHFSFVIGQDRRSDAPWNYKPLPRAAMLGAFTLGVDDNSPIAITWPPLLLEPGQKQALDIYFMPHLTVSGEGANGAQQACYVAMCFIEMPDGTATAAAGQTGLEKLTRAVLLWAIAAIINRNQSAMTRDEALQATVTLDELQTLYRYLAKTSGSAPIRYANDDRTGLLPFLSDYFDINIIGPDPNKQVALQVTVFPVIPELQIAATLNGSQGPTFNFKTDNQVGAAYQDRIRTALDLMAVDYRSKVEREADGAATTGPSLVDPSVPRQDTPTSLATAIFQDYFLLLVKAALQDAIDVCKRQAQGPYAVHAIVDAVASPDNLRKIGGMAARFLLHGLRLPALNGDASGTTLPLYTLTGQQMAVPTLKHADHIDLLNPQAVPWIRFDAIAPDASKQDTLALHVPIPDTEISRLTSLVATTLDPSTTPMPPRAMAAYRTVKQTFGLKSETAWHYPGTLTLPRGTTDQSAASSPTIWRLSDALLAVLETSPDPAGLALQPKKATQEAPDRPTTTTDLTQYAWATVVEVTLRNVVAADATAPILANTYEIVGADETGIIYLERLLAGRKPADDVIEQIQILYRPAPTSGTPEGLESAANGEVDLAVVQANLSTETHPVEGFAMRMLTLGGEETPPPRNTLTPFRELIAALWECSIVRSGGYYLYYSTHTGNKGLPSHLFDASATAKITLLITYKPERAADFVTSIVLGEAVETAASAIYLEAETLTARVATRAPGTIGFELERAVPPPYQPNQQSADQDRHYLEHQFNLLGYRLDGDDRSAGFETVPEALIPLGPTNGGDGNDGALWSYRAVVPVAKHARNRSVSRTPEYPPAADDPYAGVGAVAVLHLSWRDMFGNKLRTPLDDQPLRVPVWYSDPLFAITKWPSVTSHYAFGPAQDDQIPLTIGLHFDTTRYEPPPPGSTLTALTRAEYVKNAKIAAVTYRRIYYQLIQEGVEVFIQSTIDGQGAEPGPKLPVDRNALIDFAGAIYAYVQGIISSTTPAARAITPPVIVNPIDAARTNASEIFELVVNLTIARTQYVDPDLTEGDGVAAVTSTIAPHTGDSSVSAAPQRANVTAAADGTPNPPPGGAAEITFRTLRHFAEQFETAFKDRPAPGVLLKIALGINQHELTNAEQNKKVWIIRFDPTGRHGLWYGADKDKDGTTAKRYFFAPPPLATSLQTLTNVPISVYQSNQETTGRDDVHRQTFAGVDLDTWGRQCLEAIEEFLSARFIVPAFLLDNGATLAEILASKAKLAEAITGTLDWIVEVDDGANIAQAQEKLRQQLLNDLRYAYRVAAVVQHPVTVQSGFSGSNQEPFTKPPYVPRLFGKLSGTASSGAREAGAHGADDYALSTAKVPLGTGQSWLTYLFETTAADQHRSFTFDHMQYRVSAIEHEIEDVVGMGSYKASTWLTFVLPLDAQMGEIGPVTIPVPLHAFPIPPSVTAQGADYALLGGSDKTTTIEAARTWGYRFTYRQAEAAQDEIEAQIHVNVDDAESDAAPTPLAATPVVDLPTALAQFVSSYPAIKQDFVDTLPTIDATTIKQSGLVSQAMHAVSTFSTLIAAVAEGWSHWNQGHRSNHLPAGVSAGDGQQAATYAYTIRETEAQGADGELIVTVDSSTRGTPAATIAISGYRTVGVSGTVNSYRFAVADGSGQAPTYLRYADRNSVAARTVSIEGLDILDTHNGWAGVIVTRNKDLIQNADGTDATTNPNFWYQTPLVRFANTLIPLLACNETIDVARIADPTAGDPAPQPLAQHMHNLVAALLGSVRGQPMASTATHRVQLECAYQYTLDGALALPPVVLPVVLTPSIDLADETSASPTDPNSFAGQLAAYVLHWFRAHTPSQQRAAFLINVTVYSPINSQLPLLKLTELRLGVNSIADLVGGAV